MKETFFKNDQVEYTKWAKESVIAEADTVVNETLVEPKKVLLKYYYIDNKDKDLCYEIKKFKDYPNTYKNQKLGDCYN